MNSALKKDVATIAAVVSDEGDASTENKLLPFDAAQYFTDIKSQNELIADALETGKAGTIASALGVVVRARGVSAVAKEAGVTREALYKYLGEHGDPRLSTLLGVLKALGVKLVAASA